MVAATPEEEDKDKEKARRSRSTSRSGRGATRTKIVFAAARLVIVFGWRASRGAFERDNAPLSRERIEKSSYERHERARGRTMLFPFDRWCERRSVFEPADCAEAKHTSEKKKKLKTSRLRCLCSSLSSPLLRTHASLRAPSPLCCPRSSTSTSERETENTDPRKAAKRKTKDTDAIQTSTPCREKHRNPRTPVVAPPFFQTVPKRGKQKGRVSSCR